MTVKDILLVSDIDGTLIDSQYRIPERNREAIQRWMAQGGGFAIATGRSWESVEKCLGDLRVNRPCVLANGGLVYDLESHTPVSVQALPQEARAYTRKMMEQFPDAGIEVFTASDVWILRENDITRAHMANEGIHCRFGPLPKALRPRGCGLWPPPTGIGKCFPRTPIRAPASNGWPRYAAIPWNRWPPLGTTTMIWKCSARQASRRRLPTRRRRFAKWRDLWLGPAMKAR